MSLWHRLKFKLDKLMAGGRTVPQDEVLDMIVKVSFEALKEFKEHPPLLYAVNGRNVIPKMLDFSSPGQKLSSLIAGGAAVGHFQPDYAFIVTDGYRRETTTESDENGQPLDGIMPSEMPMDDRIECLSFLCWRKGKLSHYFQDYKRTGRDFDVIEKRGKLIGPHDPSGKTNLIKDFLFGVEHHASLERLADRAKKGKGA